MITLYGITNCDTMKKARRWLDARGVIYIFHDYARSGLEEERLRRWVTEVGWENLVNRRGTTWRKLSAEIRDGMDEESAIRVMHAAPSLIHRPVLDLGDRLYVGFSETRYAEIFD